MACDRARLGRVAGHQPVEPVRLHGRELDQLQRFSVVHVRPRGSSRSRRPASSSASSRTRRRASARRVRVFTVPSGHAEPLGDLLLREAIPIGQHDHGPLHLRHRGEGGRDGRPHRRPPRRHPPGSGQASHRRGPSRRARAGPSRHPPRRDPRDSRAGRAPVVGPSARSRSTVRLRAMARSHVPRDASAGSNSSARFQSARNVSCTTSSARPRSPVSRSATAWMPSTCRS